MKTHRVTIHSHSESDTFEFGRKLSKIVTHKDIVCLFGNLGSGKTVIVKGLSSAMGIDPAQVISPTFVLMRQYQGKTMPVYHFDFYRLNGFQEIAPLGFDEFFFGDGVCLIEWPQRLSKLLPQEYFHIDIKIGEAKSRMITIRWHGENHQSRMKDIKKLFLN